ncbi:hypothetical protein ECC02_012861 [Trypanosoma cruzi]|uniref:Uncharacterized protein n=1 Tax=Trypanosoma cruzi TaxID=5693 RepID=A0A7J6XK01_TRYCR|nr:hypothetical protein ECC02_012861 [Trypanosoma cruzi]
MLSRVAAVKAPRTHNRRRVTGSSGRRREGRESEPQRSNMSRHLFYSAVLLLLVVMMCCACEAALAEEKSTDPKFEWKGITEGDVTVESLGVPGLLNVGSDVFAVAEAQCKQGQDSFAGIASQILTEKKDNTPEEIMNDAKKDTQVLEEGTTASNKKVDVSRPTTAVKGNDIYMLVGKYSRTDAADARESGGGDWGLLLVKGKVSAAEGKKKIQWNENQRLAGTLSDDEQDSLMQLFSGGGSGLKMNDDMLVFPVEGKKEKGESNDGKTVSLLIYTSEDSSWKLLKGMSADGCSAPSVVEWEKDKKLMMMTACDGGRRRVYESGDKGESWTEALGTLSRVWGNKKGEKVEIVRCGFITANVEDRDVMLVTLPVYSKEKAEKDKEEKSVLHLWLTDNTHIVDIGPVSEKEDEDAAASSLLYKSADNNEKEELIALYEKKEGGDKDTASLGMVSARLTEQLQRVKEVLKKWKKVDDIVSKLCISESVEKDISTDNACGAVKITDGLVGFLSGNFSDNTWRDEYLGVDATVKNNDEGVEQVESGVKFKGRGAGAEWPVGSQGENQLYHFANYKFTLVATVSIDGELKEGNIPLLGVKLDGEGEKKPMELSYDNEKKWQFLCGGGQNKEHSRDWDPETTKKDHVVILIRNGSHFSAYVDGKRVGEDAQCQLENTGPKEISHFYIGGDGNSAVSTGIEEDVSVTVTNVLLYNRPLNDAGITAINTNKHSIQRLTDLKNVARDTRSPDVGTKPTLAVVSETTRHGQQPLKHEPLKGDEGAGSGGASNSAKTTMTTHSVGSLSAEQLPSGGSHDGNKNVNVDSSSNGNPAVGTVGGDTTQGNGSPQIPVGISDTADANTPTTEGEGQDGPTVNPEAGASSGESGEPTEEANGQEEEVQPQDGDLNAAALSSSVGNVSQGHNSDSGSMRESGLLPSLFFLLGLWGFAAL